MKNLIRISVALGAFVLVGCGGRPLAANKEAAAGAVFQASRGALGAPGMLAQVMSSAALGEIKVNCQRGGSVAIKFTVDASGEQTGIGYDLVYDGCSFDGHSSMRGTLHMTFETVTTETSVALALHLVGKVSFSGEISDFVDVDITENVTAGELTSPGVTVSLTLDGAITTSSGTYTFADEIVVVAPALQKAPEET